MQPDYTPKDLWYWLYLAFTDKSVEALAYLIRLGDSVGIEIEW